VRSQRVPLGQARVLKILPRVVTHPEALHDRARAVVPGHGEGQHFSLPAFLAGQKTSTYTNAPQGLLYR